MIVRKVKAHDTNDNKWISKEQKNQVVAFGGKALVISKEVNFCRMS